MAATISYDDVEVGTALPALTWSNSDATSLPFMEKSHDLIPDAGSDL